MWLMSLLLYVDPSGKVLTTFLLLQVRVGGFLLVLHTSDSNTTTRIILILLTIILCVLGKDLNTNLVMNLSKDAFNSPAVYYSYEGYRRAATNNSNFQLIYCKPGKRSNQKLVLTAPVVTAVHKITFYKSPCINLN